MRIADRLKTVPTWMSSALFAVGMTVIILTDEEGPALLSVLGSVVAVFGFMLGFMADHDVKGGIECTKCGHQRRDHSGPCQECLRYVQNNAADAPDVPCSRFSKKASATPVR